MELYIFTNNLFGSYFSTTRTDEALYIFTSIIKVWHNTKYLVCIHQWGATFINGDNFSSQAYNLSHVKGGMLILSCQLFVCFRLHLFFFFGTLLLNSLKMYIRKTILVSGFSTENTFEESNLIKLFEHRNLAEAHAMCND